jgi:putative alpha-1,2-mannosidase
MYKNFKQSLFPVIIKYLTVLIISGLFGIKCVSKELSDYAKYVDPLIGTGIYSVEGAMGEINTFPGVSLPHGMVQLSPDTDRHIAGYMYDDKNIEGFSHTHVTGTGCWGFGNFLVMPMVGPLKIVESDYRSTFSHKDEKATPGYYSVTLDDYGIIAELTATTRVGFHRYTFPQSEDVHIIMDVTHNLADSSDIPTEAHVEIVDEKTLIGSVTIPNPFCGGKTPYTLYFAAVLSEPYHSFGTWSGNKVDEDSRTQSGTDIGAFLNYKTKKDEQILIKVGISYVSTDQAMFNLREEIPDWDFDRVRKEARDIWNEKLNRIKVEGGNDDDKIKFYTALYHAFLGPYSASDVNGKYFGMDNKVHTAKDHIHYHVYSLWDTFRSEHPLLTIVEPKEQNDMIITLIEKYEQGGWLPRWEFANRYTNCMIADHATPVIADTYLKGIRDYDVEKAYKAMRKNATRLPRSGHISIFQHRGHFTPLVINSDGKAYVSWFTTEDSKTLQFDWRWKYNDMKWHHYAVTYNSKDKITVYIDGKEVASTEENLKPLALSENSWSLGADIEQEEPREFFTGNLDELYVYNREFTEEEIQQLQNGTAPMEGMVLYLPFDDEGAGVVHDHSSFKNFINVTGNPEWEEGNFNKSLVFDGVNDFITIQNTAQLNPSSEISVSFWFITSLPTDFEGRRGLDYYQKYGYIPHDVDWHGWGSVSTTLEDAYNDWALAQVAKDMGKKEDYDYFMKRAGYYKNLFDPTTGLMRPRNEYGTWKEPFDPKEWDGFTEGNSWTYTWFVPHDVHGLINLMGRDSFIEKLDYFFSEYVYPKWDELFSNYWHGNEPDQQAPYLYNYIGQPWKTQKLVRDIMDKLYGTDPAGIPGNEDVGQLSAWYILSAMGFYPVAPAELVYIIGSPIFERVTIYLDKSYYDADKFIIEAENNSSDNIYIQSVTLNGKEHKKSWFTHSEIKNGGILKFLMGPLPNKKWGSAPEDTPPSMSGYIHKK